MSATELDNTQTGVNPMTEGEYQANLNAAYGGVETLVCHPSSMTHASVELERRHRIPGGGAEILERRDGGCALSDRRVVACQFLDQ